MRAPSPAVQRLLTAAAEPGVVVLAGDYGSGVRRVLDDALAAWHAEGRPVARAWTSDPGGCTSAPGSGVLAAVPALRPHLERVGLEPVAGALRPWLPELADVLPPAPAGEPGDPAPVVTRAVVALLRALDRPVLVVEDVEATDAAARDLLRAVGTQLAGRLTLVLTARRADALARTLPDLLRRGRPRTVVLAPREPSATAALAAEALAPRAISHAAARVLHERSGGLPAVVDSLVAAIALARTPAERVEADDVEAARLDDEVLGPARADLAVQPAAVRDVILAAAVLRCSAPDDDTGLLRAVCVAAGAAADDVDEAIARAQEAALLHETRGRQRLNPVLAAAAEEQTVPARRRRWHHWCAVALAGSTQRDPARLAVHHRAADEHAAWLLAAEEAAVLAHERRDDDEACALLEPLLDQAPLSAAERSRVVQALCRTACNSSRGAHMVGVLEDVAAHEETDPADRALAQGTAAIILANDLGPAAHVRALCRLAAESDELTEGRRLQLALVEQQHVPAEETGAAIRRSVDRLDAWVRATSPPEQRTYTDVHNRAAVQRLRLLIGDPVDATALATLPDDAPGSRMHDIYLGEGLLHSGRFAAAEPYLRRFGAALEDPRSLLASAALADLQLVRYRRGDWAGLGRDVAALRERPRLPAAVADLAALLAVGLRLAGRGRPDAVAGTLDAVVRRVSASGCAGELALAVGLRAELAVLRRERTPFPGLEDQLRRLAHGQVFPPFHAALPAVAQALLVAGRLDDARGVLEATATTLDPARAPLAAGAHRHARGLLLAAEGELAEAVVELSAAGALHAAAEHPLAAAAAHEQAARALLAGAAERGARPGQELAAAARLLEPLGPTRYLDRVRRLARDHGVPLPSPRRSVPRGTARDLSPREREVADLAASGLTNAEIAELLFVSVNTVNKQMRGVLRKLGLASRRELPRVAHRTRAGA